MKKFILRLIPVLMVCLVVFVPTIFGLSATQAENDIKNAGSDIYSVGDIKSPAYKIWNTIATILQIVAVAAIVFAGVRYMLAGADEKANIKNGMIVIVLGAIMVFGATSIIKIIANTTNTITN